MRGSLDERVRDAEEIAREIREHRHGPNRVMEVQRARMWERDPAAWTRYERRLAEAFDVLVRDRERLQRIEEAAREWQDVRERGEDIRKFSNEPHRHLTAVLAEKDAAQEVFTALAVPSGGEETRE